MVYIHQAVTLSGHMQPTTLLLRHFGNDELFEFLTNYFQNYFADDVKNTSSIQQVIFADDVTIMSSNPLKSLDTKMNIYINRTDHGKSHPTLEPMAQCLNISILHHDLNICPITLNFQGYMFVKHLVEIKPVVQMLNYAETLIFGL